MIKTDPTTIFIKNLKIGLRTKVVLISLGVKSVYDLYVMHLLDVQPSIGTCVSTYPFVECRMDYTEEMDKEVKAILTQHFEAEELQNANI